MSLLSIGALAISAVIIGSVVVPVLANRQNEADDLAASFGWIVPNHAEAADLPDTADDLEPNLKDHSTVRTAGYRDDDADHEIAASLRERAASAATSASLPWKT